MYAVSARSRASDLSRSDGMRLLRDAWECAAEIDLDPWQLAVEIGALHRADLSNTDLRWLLSRGFLQHAVEITRRADSRRRFTKLRSLTLADKHCFVLTRAGCTFSESQADERQDSSHHTASGVTERQAADGRSRITIDDGREDSTPTASADVPRWDAGLHDLWFGGRIIKRFVRPAPVQELILSVFEEEGWPPGIDDPLPAKSCQDPKRRLHYTVQNLNRGQKPPRLHFFINGNGQLVRWQPVAVPRAAH